MGGALEGIMREVMTCPALVPQQESQDGGSVEELSDTSCLVAFIHLLNDIFWKIFAKRPGNPSIAPVVNPGESI